MFFCNRKASSVVVRAVGTARARSYATTQNAPLAQKLKINGDRLWTDIHETGKWSAPSPGGLTRLCADENDKKARDWFRDQLLALGADYKVKKGWRGFDT